MLSAAKKEFIEFMMSADVLRFGDFVTKSGRNTPYFVNTGNYKTGHCKVLSLVNFMLHLSRKLLGIALTPCLVLHIKEFRW